MKLGFYLRITPANASIVSTNPLCFTIAKTIVRLHFDKQKSRILYVQAHSQKNNLFSIHDKFILGVKSFLEV